LMDTADSYSRQHNLQKSISVSDSVFALIPQPLLPILGEGEKACKLACSTRAGKFKFKQVMVKHLEVLLPSPSIGRGAGGEGKTLKRSPTR
jgi:hypothetical protein